MMHKLLLLLTTVLSLLLVIPLSAQVQVGDDIVGATNNEFSGSAISLSADGTRIAVGAHGNSEVDFRTGYVRVFEWNGEAWLRIGSAIYGEENQEFLGTAVALSADGNRLAVGASAHDGNGVASGRVQIYDWDGIDWVQVGNDIFGESSADRSGGAIALSAD